MAPLAVGKIWGIGPKTTEALNAVGIARVVDLTAARIETLWAHLGRRRADELLQMARGIDDSPVVVEREPKSWSGETTFPRDEVDPRVLWAALQGMAGDLSTRLVRNGLVASTVGVKVRYADFTTHTREQSCLHPIDTAHEIGEIARGLMRRHWTRDPVRLVGVRVSKFSPSPPYRQERLPGL